MTIQIIFVKDPFNTKKYLDDICEAIEWAKCNLYLRHRIKLSGPFTKDNIVYVELNSDCSNDIKNYGHHLKGISGYLLKQYPEKYKKMKIGNRLLLYIRMEEFDE